MKYCLGPEKSIQPFFRAAKGDRVRPADDSTPGSGAAGGKPAVPVLVASLELGNLGKFRFVMVSAPLFQLKQLGGVRPGICNLSVARGGGSGRGCLSVGLYSRTGCCPQGAMAERGRAW